MHLPTGCHMADSEFSIIFSRIQPRCSSFTLFIISYHVTKFYFNQFLAPYSTISPHLTTTTTSDHFITTFLQRCSPRLSQEQWTQMINYLHVPHCENKNRGKSIFPFSIYLQSTMNLDLPTPSTCQIILLITSLIHYFSGWRNSQRNLQIKLPISFLVKTHYKTSVQISGSLSY